MQSQVSEISPVMVEVTVEVPWSHVHEHLEKALRRTQSQVRLRGFRPGKVPRQMVQKLMGNDIKSDVFGKLVQEGLLSAIESHKLEPVAPPTLSDGGAIEDGQPLTFKAKMEVRPKLDEVVTEGLEVERPKVQIDDEAVEREVQQLREQNAELVTPDPTRPATKGDMLTVDYRVSVAGEEKPELGAQDRDIEVGSERLLPELVTGLVGLQPGESKDIEVHFGEDVGREDLREKTAVFHVTVKALREKVLPELDDEFAKDCGDYEGLDDLRRSIRERLEKMAEQRADSQVRERVVDALVDKNDIPVPPSLVEQQQQAMLQELTAFQQMVGGSTELDDEMKQDMHARAERKVKAALLFGELARQQEIKVEQPDVDARLQEIAEQSGKHVAKVRAEFQGERREALESQLLENKLLEYLLARATIKESTESVSGAEETNE